MAEIEDPWYSRPIDVHRWSDHPNVAKIVDRVWSEHFEDGDDKRPGPKPKTSHKNQLKVLLLDLYVSWLEDPEQCLGVSMSVNAYHTGSRYNALHISKHILHVIWKLREVGLIDFSAGSFAGAGAGGNRTSRVRASKELQAMFRGDPITRDDVYRAPEQECIILRGSDRRDVEYEDTEQTNRWRADLMAYNACLADVFIDVFTLEEPKLVLGQQKGRDMVQFVDRHHQFVRRVFSRGDWGLNGRFYGAWWQLIGSEHRKHILINDTPTVEVDFKALHVEILSGEQSVVLEGDPYELPKNTVAGTPPVLQRKLVKSLLLTALNAPDEKKAFRSFRDSWPEGHFGKSITDKELRALSEAFLEKHPHLRDFLFADQGIRLMNIDGQIVDRVHRHFTGLGVPVLSVHDSFIIDYSRVGELKRVMADASREVVGRELPVSFVGLGLDEVDDKMREDLKSWRDERVERCDGYLARKSAWEKRTGREVVPWG